MEATTTNQAAKQTNIKTSRSSNQFCATPFPSRPARIKKCSTPVTHWLQGVNLSIPTRYKAIQNSRDLTNAKVYDKLLDAHGEALLGASKVGLLSDDDLSFVLHTDPYERACGVTNSMNLIVKKLNQSLVQEVKQVSQTLMKDKGFSKVVVDDAYKILKGLVGFGEYSEQLAYIVDIPCVVVHYETEKFGRLSGLVQGWLSSFFCSGEGRPLCVMLEGVAGLYESLFDNRKDYRVFLNYKKQFESFDRSSDDFQERCESFVKVVCQHMKDIGLSDSVEELFMYRFGIEELEDLLNNDENSSIDYVDVAFGLHDVIENSTGIYAISSHHARISAVEAFVKKQPEHKFSLLYKALESQKRVVDWCAFGDALTEDGLAGNTLLHCPVSSNSFEELGLYDLTQEHYEHTMNADEGIEALPIAFDEHYFQQVKNRVVNTFLSFVCHAYLDHMSAQ